jgi:hypothetical protein
MWPQSRVIPHISGHTASETDAPHNKSMPCLQSCRICLNFNIIIFLFNLVCRFTIFEIPSTLVSGKTHWPDLGGTTPFARVYKEAS